MEPGSPDYVVKDQILGDTEPTLASPIACSGVFLELYNKGRLHELSPLIVEVEAVLLKEQRIRYDMSEINNIFWLNRLARNNPDDLSIKLIKRAEKLETQLSHAQAQIDRLRSLLESKCPGLFTYLESYRYQIGRRSPFVRRTNKLTKCRQVVLQRNKIIRRYADQSALQVCRDLDDAFPALDNTPAPQFPRSWYQDFRVKTFTEAYLNPGCRPRAETLISRVKHDLRIR